MNTHQVRERDEIKTVLVRMADDELIEGVISALDLDQPDFELTARDEGSNNRQMLVPLAAVKSILIERRYADGEFSGAGHLHGQPQKVVVRFWDGEVMKGLVRHAPKRCRYGLQIEILNTARDMVEVLAIPHSAIKGLFFVKSWDSRAGEYVRETGHWELHRGETPLVDLLGEIRSLGKLRADGTLSDDEFVRRRRFVLDRI